MNLYTKAVHAGDRRKPTSAVPVTTPIHTATTFLYDEMAQLDRVFGREEQGYSYSRYGSPTNAALEELVTALENGHGSLGCSSGMAAVQIALLAALVDRPKSVLAARALYGATIGLLVETVSNPLLRVGAIDRLAAIARAAGVAFVVDNTFATPMLVRPLELGANLVVHSLTKFLAGHGDVLGGTVTSDSEHYETLRALSRACGPVLGPFESYLAMRGIKTFPLRMERQCANASRIAVWLAGRPQVERVHFPGDPAHPDAPAIARLFAPGLYGAMVSFELKDAGREAIFRFMDRLKLIVRGTSLGDVHSIMLYPAMSSHREVPPAERRRMGIRDSLVRLSVGIEAAEDILADLEQALG